MSQYIIEEEDFFKDPRNLAHFTDLKRLIMEMGVKKKDEITKDKIRRHLEKKGVPLKKLYIKEFTTPVAANLIKKIDKLSVDFQMRLDPMMFTNSSDTIYIATFNLTMPRTEEEIVHTLVGLNSVMGEEIYDHYDLRRHFIDLDKEYKEVIEEFRLYRSRIGFREVYYIFKHGEKNIFCETIYEKIKEKIK